MEVTRLILIKRAYVEIIKVIIQIGYSRPAGNISSKH